MAMDTGRFDDVGGWQRIAAQDVHSPRHSFKMKRIDAAPHAAKMVELQPVRNGLHVEHVGKTMGQSWTMGDGKHAVTATIQVTEPQPTSGCLVHITPEAFRPWAFVDNYVGCITEHAPSQPMCRAPPPRSMRT